MKSQDVLTLKAMEAPDWEPALTLPLPEAPGLELLEEARLQVIGYLDFVSHELTQGGSAEEIEREISRAAARLAEIALAMSAAIHAEGEARTVADAERLVLHCVRCDLVTEIQNDDGSPCPGCGSREHVDQVKVKDFVPSS